MRLVVAALVGRAQRLHERAPVVGELVNGMRGIVDEPDVFLCVIRADEHGMGAAEHRIPLRPRLVFDEVALAIEDDDVVLPAGVDAQFPAILAAARARSAGIAKVGRDASPEVQGKGNAAGEPGNRHGLGGGFDHGQLAALKPEHAVRALGKDALGGAPGPVLVPFQLGQRLRPVRNDLVGSEEVRSALLAGYCREADLRRGLHRGWSARRRDQEPMMTPNPIARIGIPYLRI